MLDCHNKKMKHRDADLRRMTNARWSMDITKKQAQTFVAKHVIIFFLLVKNVQLCAYLHQFRLHLSPLRK